MLEHAEDIGWKTLLILPFFQAECHAVALTSSMDTSGGSGCCQDCYAKGPPLDVYNPFLVL